MDAPTKEPITYWCDVCPAQIDIFPFAQPGALMANGWRFIETGRGRRLLCPQCVKKMHEWRASGSIELASDRVFGKETR